MSPDRIRGAVYIPARAYNVYQMWREYDPQVTERDLSYAKSLRLNALRLWTSYEWWLEDRDSLEKSMRHLFTAAERQGIRLLVSAFEGCGVEPTRERFLDKDPWTAVCVTSPGEAVIGATDGWRRPLALEPANEPRHTVAQTRFVRALFREARRLNAPCRLSHGALGGVLLNIIVMDLGVDILQTHENFPRSVEAFEEELRRCELLAEGLERDVYITEWQRVRTGGPGWERGAVLGSGEWEPNLASLAPSVHRHPRIGSFFWSLMLKPAYLPEQRPKGTLNGVFHEDGCVYSLADARAVSENAKFTAQERREWPEWASEVPKKAGLQRV